MLHDLGRVLGAIHQIPQDAIASKRYFPGDQGAADLRARAGRGLRRCSGAPRPVPASLDLTLDLPPEQFVARTLATLPAVPTMVALHANPGPEHTFADPGTGAYVGTIDFGDAYISHPALDLRRWRDPADREALLAGYQAEQPVSAEFMQVWRMTQTLADLAVIATAPAMRDVATAHLQQLWV